VRRVLFIALLFVPPLVWVLLDRSVWPWDPAWYGEVSVDLYAALLRSFPEWVRMLATGLPDRAPGLVWVGQFFVPLGGPKGLLLFSVLLQAAAAWTLFRALAALFEDELAAFASVAFVCSGPLFAGMTQSYFTEPFEGLGVALFVYFLARADRRPLWRSALLLGAAALAAAFGKITAGLYLLCPALLFAALCVRRRAELRERPRLDRSGALLAFAFAAVALVFGAWLLICGKAVFERAFASASGPLAELYGTRGGFGHKLIYWMGNLDRMFLGPVTRVAFLAAFGAAIAMAFARRKRLRWADRIALASISGIALVVLVLSLIVNEDARFLFCVFPFAGVAACWALARLGRRAISIAYLSAALAQFGLLYAQAFGLMAPQSYVRAIDRTGAGLDLVRRAVASTCTPQQDGRLFMAGLDIPRFNGNSLSFYSALANSRAGFKCYYDRLGPVDGDTAWKNALERHAAGFLFLDGEAPRDAFNRASAPVLKRALRARQLRLRPVEGAPGLLLFLPAYEPNWRLRDSRASVWTDVAGRTQWRVHAPQAALEFTRPLPPEAALSGTIEAADPDCRGVELELSTGGGSRQAVVALPHPVAGRDFLARVGNAPGDTLSVRVLNPGNCSLLFGNVRVGAPAPRWTVQ
jgi:hypothetical protein